MIEATKRAGSDRALDELRIEITGEGDSLSVRTRYSRPHWLLGSGRVDYVVRVPRGARVKVENVNGRVEVEGVAGEVGASTVNGSIRGTLGSSQWTEALEFKTVNGSISLDLPADLSTDVRATTVNGPPCTCIG